MLNKIIRMVPKILIRDLKCIPYEFHVSQCFRTFDRIQPVVRVKILNKKYSFVLNFKYLVKYQNNSNSQPSILDKPKFWQANVCAQSQLEGTVSAQVRISKGCYIPPIEPELQQSEC